MDTNGNPMARRHLEPVDLSFPVTKRVLLPPDVLIVPASAVAVDVRSQLKFEDGEYAVTRIGTRTPSRIIDTQAADLLSEFRTPRTIIEAVIRYSLEKGIDPRSTLEDAFPLLERFIFERLLVSEGSEDGRPMTPTLSLGEELAGFEIHGVVQVLEDTEVYRAADTKGQPAALKIARTASRRSLTARFARETAILRHLDGQVNPSLLAEGQLDGRPYFFMEWCSGISATHAVGHPHRPTAENDAQLLHLCQAIVRSYTHLHAQGVVHGDVHPRNVLIGDDHLVTIVDFGFARLNGLGNELHIAERGGVDFYLEPEYARARLAKRKPPAVTFLGEQYSLAALIYQLMTGSHYARFSLEKGELRRQVVEQEPLGFEVVGRAPWPELERVLNRALAKNPRDRFPTLEAFADELAAAHLPEDQERPSQREMKVSRRPAFDSLVVDTALQQLGLSAPLFASGSLPAPIASVNYGAAGIAYAVYRVACSREDPALLALADAWSNKAIASLTDEHAFVSQDLGISSTMVGATSLYHAVGGVHLVQALVSQAMGDAVSQQAAADAFIDASRASDKHLDLTLGRSGSLLGCALLLESMRMDEFLDSQPLIRRGDELAGEIWVETETFDAIAQCAAFPYLGIAHGWAGVLYASLAWFRAAHRPISTQIVQKLEQLADLAEPVAYGVRWPIRVLPRPEGDHRDRSWPNFMSGWCNGSAGFVFLWTLAYELTGESRYLALAERAAWNAWKDPDPLVTVCCGLAGRAYAMLNMSRATGEQIWLERALNLANEIDIDFSVSDSHRHSLYKGSLGAIVLLSDLNCPAEASLPVFESEGWSSRPALQTPVD
jgi:eukaryotic-like serine/threonine-protein kinase